MKTVFIEILNMSFMASIAACAVILARFLLKRAPKIFSYALWAVVLFRLVCPFSLESFASLMPANPNPVPQNIVNTHAPSIQSDIPPIDNAVNFYLATKIPNDKDADDSPAMLGIMGLGAFVWMSGFVVLLAYALFAYIKLKRKLKTATLVDGNIYETDQIASPFVLGFIKPRIYLPVGMENTGTILAHERTHIKRRDYLIKPLAFLALCLHWFNPVIWLSYFLMCKDMEMSCDESVLKHSDVDIRGEYSSSMLSVSMKRSGLLSPLAFGESNTKARVRNVLRYRKPAFWISIVAIILVLGVTIAFAADKATIFEPEETPATELTGSGADGEPQNQPPIEPLNDADSPGPSVPISDTAYDNDYLWPVSDFYDIAMPFGIRLHPIEKINFMHDGIDIAADRGTPVLAARGGEVAELGSNETNGNYILLRHDNTWSTFYAQLSAYAEGIAVGKSVTKGETIGYVGATGQATGNHLHFGMSKDGAYINPFAYAFKDIAVIAADPIKTETVTIEGFEEEIQLKQFVSQDGYAFYYEFERYGIAAEANKTIIYPLGDPDMKFAYATIEHVANTSAEDEMRLRMDDAAKMYTKVNPYEDKSGFYAVHEDGVGGLWSTDDYELKVDLYPDGTEGCYVLSIWHVMEASEGHGVRLAHMLQSFSPFTAVPEHTYFDGYDKQEVEAFAGDIKRFMETGDKESLSVLISYPINVTIDGRKTPISDAGQFIEMYARVVNQDFLGTVLAAPVTDMFSNYMGVMIGNGEIWFGHISGRDGLWIYAINNGPGEIAQSGEDFLNSTDGEAFQSVAYSAAAALLRADAAELAGYLENPDDAPRSVRGLQNIFDDVAFISLIWGSDSIRSDNEIHISYRYALAGDDSVSYVTMELVKTDDIWKVRWLGVEK